MKYNAARALHGCDPKTITELCRGYKLAKDAGLLGVNAADKAPVLPGCDCQCPTPKSGVALVSESCPIHGSQP